MAKTAIRSSLPSAPEPPAAVGSRPKKSHRPGPVRYVLLALASLKLTVVLFALAIVLVFFGTLAEADQGLWVVVSKFFRSYTIAWIPLAFFSRRLYLPWPGGWLIGGLLLVNLLAAHAVRFRLTWRRAGVMVLHTGVILLMLSEVITGVLATEGNMTIEEGKWCNYVEDRRSAELAIIDPSDPKVDHVTAIPAGLLTQGGTLSDERLPFNIEVVRYMVNSTMPEQPVGFAKPGSAANPATAGDGLSFVALERKEAAGVDSAVDVPSAYLTFRDKSTGKSLGTFLVSALFSGLVPEMDMPQRVHAGDRRYDVYLRFQRTYKPYSVYLYKFEHDKYLGTDIAKNFSSQVRLVDPGEGEDRDNVRIWMNHPLHYRGDTFFQSSFLEDGRRGTVLQVVRNPSDALAAFSPFLTLPILSCFVVGLGMLIHFGITLVTFLQRRAAA